MNRFISPSDRVSPPLIASKYFIAFAPCDPIVYSKMHISLQYRPLNSAVFRVRDQSQRVPFHLTIGRDLVEWASRVSTFSLIPRSEPTVNLPGTTRSYCFGSTSESRPGDSKFCRARRSLGALDNSFDRRAGFLNGFGLITGR